MKYIIIILLLFLGHWATAQVQLTSIKNSPTKFKIPIAQRTLSGQTGFFQEYGDLAVLIDSLGIDLGTTIDSLKYNQTNDSLYLYTSEGVYKTLIPTTSGTVTSVGLTLGTFGTDVNVDGSPITSSGNITLNLPTASASNRGLLSMSDWSLFSGKIGGSGNANKLAIFSGATTITDDSELHYISASNIMGIGTSSPTTYTPLSASGAVIYHSSTPQLGMSNSTRKWIWYGLGDDLRLWNDQNNELMWFSGDKVGIRKPNPVRTLDIDGTFRFNGSVGIANHILGRETATGDVGSVTMGNGLTLTSNILSVTSPTAGTEGEVTWWSPTLGITSDANLFWLNSQKILSIGTKTPTSYTPLLDRGLVIYGASQAQLAMANSTRKWLWYNVGNDLRLWNDQNNELMWWQGDKVGIRIAPTTTLDVNGNFKVATRTGTATSIAGWTSTGIACTASLGTGFSFSSGTLNYTESGLGTVTSIATTNGVSGGTITTSGTIQLTGQASAFHNLGTNGFAVRTSSGNVSARTLTAGTGISITNGDGISGSPVINATGGLPSGSSSQTLAYIGGNWAASSFLKTNSTTTTTGSLKRVDINNDIGGEFWGLTLNTATKFLVNGRVQMNSTTSSATTTIMGRNNDMEVGTISIASDMEINSGILTKKQVLGVLARSSGSSAFNTSTTPLKLDFNQSMVSVNANVSTGNDDITTSVTSYGAYEITCDCQFNAGSTATYNFGIYLNGSLNGSLVKQIPMTSGNTYDVILNGYTTSLSTSAPIDIRVSTTSGTSGNTIGRCLLALKGI